MAPEAELCALYDSYISRIRIGLIGCEEPARRLAQQHALPVGRLEESLLQGRRAAFDLHVYWTGEGLLDHSYDAYLLAERYGFPLGPLEDALEIGRTRYAEREWDGTTSW